MFAAVPPCHHDDLARDLGAFQHPHDDHTRPAFAIVVFQRRPVGQDHRPCVMGRFGEFLGLAERFDERFRLDRRRHRPARHSIFRPSVADDVFNNAHHP